MAVDFRKWPGNNSNLFIACQFSKESVAACDWLLTVKHSDLRQALNKGWGTVPTVMVKSYQYNPASMAQVQKDVW